jgi:hypothetical protein
MIGTGQRKFIRQHATTDLLVESAATAGMHCDSQIVAAFMPIFSNHPNKVVGQY